MNFERIRIWFEGLFFGQYIIEVYFKKNIALFKYIFTQKRYKWFYNYKLWDLVFKHFQKLYKSLKILIKKFENLVDY